MGGFRIFPDFSSKNMGNMGGFVRLSGSLVNFLCIFCPFLPFVCVSEVK